MWEKCMYGCLVHLDNVWIEIVVLVISIQHKFTEKLFHISLWLVEKAEQLYII